MTEQNPENINPEDINETEAEKLFKQSATEQGSRVVEIEEDTSVHKSRTESEAEPSDISDLKATLNKLFPKFNISIINRAAQAAMIARIATDVFLDQMYLTVTDIVEMWDEADGELDVQEVINLCYWILSIGIDGKGRVDIIQVSANASETKESSNMAAGLGLTG